MIEFKTSKGEFMVDEVDISELAMCKFFNNPKMFRCGIHLQPMFLLSEATEDDSKKVFEYMLANDNDEYGDYEVYLYFHPNGTTSYLADSAEESLKSFLRFKGIDIDGNWYLFKKI